MPRRSTTTQLLDFYHHVNNNIDSNIQTDIILLDLSEVFDSAWFQNYLTNRMQRLWWMGNTQII